MSVHAVTALTHLDVPLDDVPAGARFFRGVLALPVHVHDRHHADVDLAPGLVAHLRPPTCRADGTPGSGPAMILELRVPDLPGALAELRRRGAEVLVEPVLTEWGTRSAFLAGPDGLIVEIYHPHPD